MKDKIKILEKEQQRLITWFAEVNDLKLRIENLHYWKKVYSRELQAVNNELNRLR